MNYLEVEEWDENNKILVGVLQVIKNNQKTPVLHQTVFNSMNLFVQEKVRNGIAYVGMEDEVKESQEDEYKGDGNIDMLLQNAFADHMAEYGNVDDSIQPHEAAFRIIDIDYDPERSEILGRLELLQTEKGMEAERRISNGMRPFISQGGVEGSVEPIDVKRGNLQPCYKVVKILPTYKITFLKADETFKTLRYDEMKSEDVENPDEKFNEKIKTNLDGDARDIIGGK